LDNQISELKAMKRTMSPDIDIPSMSASEVEEFNRFIPALEDQIKQSKTASDIIEAITQALSKGRAKA
jgi:hypothetical protein